MNANVSVLHSQRRRGNLEVDNNGEPNEKILRQLAKFFFTQTLQISKRVSPNLVSLPDSSYNHWTRAASSNLPCNHLHELVHSITPYDAKRSQSAPVRKHWLHLLPAAGTPHETLRLLQAPQAFLFFWTMSCGAQAGVAAGTALAGAGKSTAAGWALDAALSRRLR